MANKSSCFASILTKCERLTGAETPIVTFYAESQKKFVLSKDSSGLYYKTFLSHNLHFKLLAKLFLLS